jgi:hypothetical protein
LLRYKDESLKLKKKPRMQIIKSLKRRMGRRKLKVQMLERDADLEEEEVSERCGMTNLSAAKFQMMWRFIQITKIPVYMEIPNSQDVLFIFVPSGSIFQELRRSTTGMFTKHVKKLQVLSISPFI